MLSDRGKLLALCTQIDAVPVTADLDEVFDLLSANADWPFVPVVDADGRPLGVIRERQLKTYAYARFGRDLLRRSTLRQHLEPSLSAESDATLDELLTGSANNPNPDGLLVVEAGVYQAVLLNPALLRLHEERHIQAKVRLANAEKMEAIGTLAGGIAHDLNNVLTPILGYAELISDSASDSPMVADWADQITVSATRASQTVRQILAFSRQQETERCRTPLSGTVREVLGLLGSSLPSTIEVEMRVETERDDVWASPAELHQMLMNLCTNAYQAMRGAGGRLVVRLAEHDGVVRGYAQCEDGARSAMLRLSVGDTGVGIAEGNLSRIFEPFFTTKRQSEGTGMGLAIVHGIVSRSGGFISVESEVGEGTTFHVHLPAMGAGAAVGAGAGECCAASLSRLPAVQPGYEQAPDLRALVVDDESQIVRLARVVLSRHRIQVHTETDSERAWELFAADPDAFDVLITDQMMPGLTGIELAARVLALRPRLPIILCTGYAEAVSPDDAFALGIRDYVLKPVDFGRVAATIRGWHGDEAAERARLVPAEFAD